ncbi:MAG: hypothetical protein ACI805_000915, partial [Candidatus Azotimanducaceae bacterium]
YVFRFIIGHSFLLSHFQCHHQMERQYSPSIWDIQPSADFILMDGSLLT